MTEFSKTFPVFYKWPDLTDVQVALTSTVLVDLDLEVLNVKVGVKVGVKKAITLLLHQTHIKVLKDALAC